MLSRYKFCHDRDDHLEPFLEVSDWMDMKNMRLILHFTVATMNSFIRSSDVVYGIFFCCRLHWQPSGLESW
jgi:hypothetical protein